jgi:tetratricopeptide (TPR) repeat protein
MLRHYWALGLAVLLLSACAGTGGRAPGSASDSVRETAAAEPVSREPTSETVMYNVMAAEFLGGEGDLTAAVGLYLEAAMESSDPEIARRATRIAFAAQAWQQAAMAADRWALLAPNSIPAHENAAAALLLTGDYAGAELQLERIIQLRGDNTEAWVTVSALLAQASDPARASVVLENVLARHGNVDNANARYAQSQLAIHERDLQKAYQLAVEAVELEPRNVEFLTWAGRLALNMNRRDEGLKFIRRAWKQEPDDHDLALAYADLLARTGQADAAREVMEEMPQSPDVMLSRILFEINDRKMDAAEKLLDEFVRMDFDDPLEKAFYLGQAAEAVGQMPRAIEYYGQVTTGEDALAAGIRRAELMAREGQLDEARRALADMRESEDILFLEESWLAEARILREAGDSEGAFNVLGLALETLPDSVPILYSHALLAAEQGWIDIAETDLRLIISAQPENAAALNALGYTLADQTSRFEEAEALIRQAYILEPDEAAIVDSMGWISYRLGRLAEAEEYLRRAWDLERNSEIGAHLGEVLWVQDRKEEARAIWAEAMKINRDDPVLLETILRLDTSP